MGLQKFACSLCGLLGTGGGIALIVYVANGSASAQVDLVDSELELVKAGSQHTCTLTSSLVNVECREADYCADWTTVNQKTSCATTAKMQQCYCQAIVSLLGTETSIPAYFSVTSRGKEGTSQDWCNEILFSETWPNFLTLSSDGSEHAYCGFRAYQSDLDIEGTSSGLAGDLTAESACAVDAVLDPDYKCVSSISKGGFTCVQVSDGRILVGSKDALVTQREDCSTLASAQRTTFLVLGIIFIVLSGVWIISWAYWGVKDIMNKNKE